MRFVDKIVQDIEVAFEPLRSFEFGEQDFEIEIPFSRDNDNFWISLNNELNSKGISYKLLDTYETDKSTIYYVMLRRKWKPEYYDEGVNRKLKLYIKESNHSIYDRFGIVIDDGKEAWILHTDSKYNLKYIKKYIDENLDDITYTLKSAAEVADYLQGVCFNKLHQFVDVDFVPETTNEESTTIKLGNTLISVVDWEYV